MWVKNKTTHHAAMLTAHRASQNSEAESNKNDEGRAGRKNIEDQTLKSLPMLASSRKNQSR